MCTCGTKMQWAGSLHAVTLVQLDWPNPPIPVEGVSVRIGIKSTTGWQEFDHTTDEDGVATQLLPHDEEFDYWEVTIIDTEWEFLGGDNGPIRIFYPGHSTLEPVEPA